MDNIDTENLRRVLERVSPTPESDPEPKPPRPNPAAYLRKFIDRASAAGGLYELLALKTRDATREKILRELARDERRNERRFQAEHFFLTGDTWVSPSRRPSAPYLLRTLRESCIAELGNAEALESAANELPSSALRDMLLDAAVTERRHADLLRTLIEKSLY